MHRYLNIPRAARFAAAALPLFFVASCGTNENSDARGTDQNETLSQLESWRTNPRDDRFSATEIASVYTTETKVVNGKKYPNSKPSLKFIYTPANAPQKFKTENGDFTQAAEIKGYLNLGYLTVPGFQQRFVSNFEKISTWTTITDSKGDSLFDDAYTVDERGRKMPDWSDGNAADTGEIHRALLKLKTNTPLGAIAIPSTVTIYNQGGEIQVDVTNESDVRAPIVGTVIKAQGMKIHLKAFPYKKGWLVYGAAAVKLEKFQDALKPDLMSTTVDSLFTWIKDQTVLPL